jgi:hypothetical protein
MKKLHLSILYVVLLSLLISGAILLSKPVEKNKYNIENIDNKKSKAVVAENSQESINAYKNEISKNETINVFNNHADIDLHANLREDKSGQVSLCLAYKLNGKLFTKNINTSKVSEIRNIFRFREVYGSGYRLDNMTLNEKMKKLYFCVRGRKDKKYTHTAVYSYDLKNSKIEKIIYNIGEFSKFSFSPNGKYNAFSYISYPQNISRNEKSIVVIMNCLDNKFILNSNKDMVQKLYEESDDLYYNNDNLVENEYQKPNDLFIYSYDFIKWRNNNICELRQRIKAKDGSIKEKEQALFYNVITNEISDE